ncbi:MAG: type II secretion system minor pseudopilin GspJ, partial [Sphingomonadaceae bacterium]|nr:type II secretion system minor pseudopilin GspJ [Sphingomonadaceae bacterium]
MTGQRGFTLAELLVALFVFAIISVAGVALLAFSVDAQAGSQRALAASDDLRRMNAALTNDLSQAVARVSRDEAGAAQAAFQGGSGADSDLLLAFVRRGWANHDGAPRSSLQKVDYRLVEGRLERRAWP